MAIAPKPVTARNFLLSREKEYGEFSEVFIAESGF